MGMEDRILQLQQQIADMEKQIDAAAKEIEVKDRCLAELREHRTEFMNLLNNAEIAALHVDNQLRIQKMTPAMEKGSKVDVSDIGRLITEVTLLDDYEELAENVKKCIELGDTIEHEIQRDGMTLMLRFCPYCINDGEKNGVLVLLYDITKKMDAVRLELQLLLNNIPGAVVKMRYNGGLIVEYANDTLYDLMKLDKQEFKERYDNHYEWRIYERDWKKLQEKINAGIKNKERVSMEYRVNSGNDTQEWRAIQASILEERGGTPILQCVISDITTEKLVRLELEKERKKLGAVLRMSGDRMFEYDIAKDYMTYTSPGEGLLFSEQITENYTKNLSQIVWKEDEDARQELVNALRSGKENIRVEFRRKDQDGEYHWVLVTGQTIYNKEHKPERVLGKIHNIDERKRKEVELRDKSQKDSLTGLYNHMTAKQMVMEKVQNFSGGKKDYLIVCDIDNFKAVNDTNGHMYGDAVLCSFAEKMSQLLPDAIKGRIGGDEFMAYVENVDRETLQEKLVLLNRFMSDRFDDDKASMHISCSLGAAVVNGSVRNFDTLFQWADYALYSVKNYGKGSYFIIDVKENMTTPMKSYLEGDSNQDMYVRRETLIRNDDELVLFCVELLENVPNITSALKMICERTCNFFDLDDMVCVEHHGAQNEILYQWSKKEKTEYTRRMHNAGIYEWDLLLPKTDEKGVAIYSEEAYKRVEMEEAKTAMLVLSKEIKDYQGSIVFTDRRKDRDWGREKDTLQRIAYQVFLHLRTRRHAEQEQKEMDRKINYDTLTGLPVYNRFVQMAEKYLQKYQRTSLFCVYSDFSNFQYFNEVYGYGAGDKVLNDYAKAVQEEYSENGLFCRVTSDHFLGIIQADNLAQALEGYRSFTQRFCTKTNAKYGQCNLVIAAGIYEVKKGDNNVAAMMDNANEARKKCKAQKVDTSVEVYTEEVKQQTESIKAIETNMVQAYNNKEFFAYLQPKVSLKTGKIVGAEALVRWIRPDGTKMMPGDFVDIFERTGFVTKMDFAILERVMEYLREALSEGEEVVPISVNFSRRHNELEGFVPSILNQLEAYEVPNSLLEVELTESVFMSDLNSLNRNLKSLRACGIEISVDDFGSGYSSLNLLSRVTVDTIKLDKQFLDTTLNATQEETALTVIKYLIKMLKHLGFKVLAEGVETEEQLEMLKKADCDFVQGYYYAKPMPIPEFREFLKKFNGEK